MTKRNEREEKNILMNCKVSYSKKKKDADARFLGWIFQMWGNKNTKQNTWLGLFFHYFFANISKRKTLVIDTC